MKRTLLVILVLILSFSLFAQPASESEGSGKIVSSTSWVASYVDLAGADSAVLAPSNLRHPPEYELSPSDVLKVRNASYFFYAGYERMMSTIKENVTSEERVDVKVSTGNSIENVKAQAGMIASILGTTPDTDEYVDVAMNGKDDVERLGIDKLKVCCHTMQLPLAKDLGLNIVATFGPSLVSAEEIEKAANGGYDIIIDNVHNPVAGPLSEVSGAKVVIWRNFPEETGKGSLCKVVKGNIDSLLEACK